MQTVATAFEILEEVADRQPIGLSDLARAMERPKSSIYRFLRALEDAGWVRPIGGERAQWVLTARAAIVARAVGRDTGLRDVARPILERLRDETGESTRLAVPDRGEVVIIERVECYHTVRIYDDQGQHGPIHATDLGKAMLAFSSRDQEELLLPSRLAAVTDRTITNRRDLERDLELTRTRGWAIAIGEARPDVGGIAAPVLDSAGQPIGAINVFFPLHRSPDDNGDAYGRLVSQAAHDISKALN